jgi:hypothetical protein
MNCPPSECSSGAADIGFMFACFMPAAVALMALSFAWDPEHF